MDVSRSGRQAAGAGSAPARCSTAPFRPASRDRRRTAPGCFAADAGARTPHPAPAVVAPHAASSGSPGRHRRRRLRRARVPPCSGSRPRSDPAAARAEAAERASSAAVAEASRDDRRAPAHAAACWLDPLPASRLRSASSTAPADPTPARGRTCRTTVPAVRDPRCAGAAGAPDDAPTHSRADLQHPPRTGPTQSLAAAPTAPSRLPARRTGCRPAGPHPAAGARGASPAR